MSKFDIIIIFMLIFKLQRMETASICKNLKTYSLLTKTVCDYNNVNRPVLFTIRTSSMSYPLDHTQININNSSITKLSNKTFSVEVKKVAQLAIRNSRVADIDSDGLIQFPDLMDLNLDYNDLMRINPVFPKQTKLEKLSLSHNKIYWIDLEAFKNTSLKSLDLSYNMLSVLNPEIDCLNKRNLSHCQLNSFGYLKHLEVLDLSNNKLGVLNKSSFIKNTNLRYLNLSRNFLVDVEVGIFENLSNLIYLNLSGNLISKLDSGFFNGLKTLQTLDLSFNRLLVFDTNEFNNSPKLENLYLNNNLIKHISMMDFIRHSKMKIISIHDNELDCAVLSQLFDLFKLYGIKVDEVPNSNHVHKNSCKISSSTQKSNETGSVGSSHATTTPSAKKMLEDIEEVFLKSTLHKMLSHCLENQEEQKNKLDILKNILQVLEDINKKQSIEMETSKNILKSLQEVHGGNA